MSVDERCKLEGDLSQVCLEALVILLTAEVLAMVVVLEIKEMNQQLQDCLPLFLVGRRVDDHLDVEVDSRWR